MAIAPSEIPLTRAVVGEWVDEYNGLDDRSNVTLEDWIRSKVEELNLPDVMVKTPGREALAEVTPLVDLIIDDLPSYPNASSDANS